MSRDATAALYAAITHFLLDDAPVASHVATRVYSGWGTEAAQFPMIRVRIAAVEPYEADCIDGSETTIDVHVYARGGPVTAANVASAVRDALDGAALLLTDAELISLDYVHTLHTASPDDPGIYTSVVRLTAITTTE